MTTQGESASNSGPKLHRVAVIGAQKNASQHLSNERTYLSYIRTAIALIGFGVATNRFSVFLIQSNEISKHESMGWSLVNLERAGLGMVISGMILVIWAVLNYIRVRRQIDRGNFRPDFAAHLDHRCCHCRRRRTQPTLAVSSLRPESRVPVVGL